MNRIVSASGWRACIRVVGFGKAGMTASRCWPAGRQVSQEQAADSERAATSYYDNNNNNIGERKRTASIEFGLAIAAARG